MSAPAPAVFVTGGTGMVGRHVLRLLAADGVAVAALARRVDAARDLWPAIDWRAGDLDRPESLRGILPPVDVLLHVAGAMPADPDSCRRVNQDATCVLLEEARRAGVRRFVHVSSVAVYGDRALESVAEDAARSGESPYAVAKIAAEDAVLAAAAGGSLSAAVLRPCPILGPGPGHFAAGVRALVTQPEVPLPDGGHRRLDLVAAEDVAAAIVAAGRTDVSGAFHLAAGDAATLAEILTLGAAAAAASPRFRPIPLADALAANRRAAASGAPPAVPWALLAYAAFERTYATDRARRLLAFAPGPVREALRQSVAAGV